MNLERDSGQDLASRDSEMEGLRSLPPVRLEGLGNRDLLDYFVNTWELYELLFDAIESDDSLYLHPDPLRHPLIFYLGRVVIPRFRRKPSAYMGFQPVSSFNFGCFGICCR